MSGLLVADCPQSAIRCHPDYTYHKHTPRLLRSYHPTRLTLHCACCPRYHPDKQKDEESSEAAAEKFRHVGHAYKVQLATEIEVRR